MGLSLEEAMAYDGDAAPEKPAAPAGEPPKPMSVEEAMNYGGPARAAKGKNNDLNLDPQQYTDIVRSMQKSGMIEAPYKIRNSRGEVVQGKLRRPGFEDVPADMVREDGTQKGEGYFGNLKRPDGKISSELSVGFNMDGKPVLAPLIVPTLDRDELNWLLDNGQPTKAMIQKAAAHAQMRIKAGKSPFAEKGEQVDPDFHYFKESATAGVKLAVDSFAKAADMVLGLPGQAAGAVMEGGVRAYGAATLQSQRNTDTAAEMMRGFEGPGKINAIAQAFQTPVAAALKAVGYKAGEDIPDPLMQGLERVASETGKKFGLSESESKSALGNAFIGLGLGGVRMEAINARAKPGSQTGRYTAAKTVDTPKGPQAASGEQVIFGDFAEKAAQQRAEAQRAARDAADGRVPPQAAAAAEARVDPRTPIQQGIDSMLGIQEPTERKAVNKARRQQIKETVRGNPDADRLQAMAEEAAAERLARGPDTEGRVDPVAERPPVEDNPEIGGLGQPIAKDLESALEKVRADKKADLTGEEKVALRDLLYYHAEPRSLIKRTSPRQRGSVSRDLLAALGAGAGGFAIGSYAVDKHYEDALDKLAPLAAAMGVIKKSGGQWSHEAVQTLGSKFFRGMHPEIRLIPDLKNLAKISDPEIANNAKFARSRINNYLERHAGQADDPIRDIEIPWFPDMNHENPPVMRPLGELMQDSIFPLPAKLVNLGKNPWAAKLHGDEPVWHLGHSNFSMEPLKVDSKNARAAQYAVENYFQTLGEFAKEIPDEVKGRWDLPRLAREHQLKLEEEARVAKRTGQNSMEAFPVAKYPDGTPMVYPDGMRWIELKQPEELTLEQRKTVRPASDEEYDALRDGTIDKDDDRPWIPLDVSNKPIRAKWMKEPEKMVWGSSPEEAWFRGKQAEEGIGLKNCIGYMCVVNDRIQIFSLRDKNGKAHANVEVKRANHYDKAFGPKAFWEQAASKEFKERMGEPAPNPGSEMDFRWEAKIERTPEFRKWRNAQPESDLGQIRGYGNGKIPEAVQAHVQDFVIKHKEWNKTHHSELENTDLVDMKAPNILDKLIEDTEVKAETKKAFSERFVGKEALLQEVMNQVRIKGERLRKERLAIQEARAQREQQRLMRPPEQQEMFGPDVPDWVQQAQQMGLGRRLDIEMGNAPQDPGLYQDWLRERQAVAEEMVRARQAGDEGGWGEGDLPAGGDGWDNGFNRAIAAVGIGAALYQMAQDDATKDYVGAAFLGAGVRGRVGPVRSALREMGRSADKLMGPLSTRLANIHPSLRRDAVLAENNILHTTQQKLQEGAPFLRAFRKMPGKLRADIQRAAYRNDIAAVNRLMPTTARQAWADITRTVRDLSRTAGTTRHDLFPRIIKDYEEMIAELPDRDQVAINNALATSQAGQFRGGAGVLTPKQATKIIEDYYYSRGGIPRNMEHFYSSMAESFSQFVVESASDIEKAKFFGPNAVLRTSRGRQYMDLGASISKLVADKTQQLQLDAKSQQNLRDILNARFVNHPAAWKWLQDATNFMYTGLLGNPISAVTQLGDVFSAGFMQQGLLPTIRAIGAQLAGKSFIKAGTEYGLANHLSEEFSSMRGSAKAMNAMFKWGGFSAMDMFGKNVAMNAALNKFYGLAQTQKGRLKIAEKYQEAFGNDFPQLIADLQAKRFSPLVREIPFLELSDWQPITKLEMPEYYLKMPNGRVAYRLHTFMIKQMDAFRREGYNEIKKGNYARGITNLAKIGFVLGFAGATTSFIQDFISGRNPKFESRDILANLFKTFGWSEYTTDMAKKKPLEQVVRTAGWGAAAPVQMMDKILTLDPSAWRYFPIIGRVLYDWGLGGKDKPRNAEERKQQREDRSPAYVEDLIRKREKRLEKRMQE